MYLFIIDIKLLKIIIDITVIIICAGKLFVLMSFSSYVVVVLLMKINVRNCSRCSSDFGVVHNVPSDFEVVHNVTSVLQ